MLRLLIAGAHVLRAKEVLVDVSEHRDRLLAVKSGNLSWDEVLAWSQRLREDLEKAAATTALPAEPNRAAVNDFLIRTRRANL